MNLQTLKLKASTLCAGGTLLVLGGFMTANLAGCGGGGGNGVLTTPTAAPVGATFRIVQQDSSPSQGGTITLTGNGKTYTATADSTGIANISTVPPGTYTVTFTAFDISGTALAATTRTLTITSSGSQSYILVQGDTGNGQYSVTGTVLLNPDDGDTTTADCTAQSVPITANILISVRDLNSTNGAPIIAQVIRPLQSADTVASLRGRYTISLPYRPRSFRVEVTPGNEGGAPFAGIGATTTFVPTVTTISNVSVCTNDNGVAPAPAVTPTPNVTPTPFGGTFSTPTPTTVGDTGGTTTIPTATTEPTATPTTGVPSPTNTLAPGAITPTPQPNATATPNLNPSPTPIGGTAGATPGVTPVGTPSTGL